jgi:hypothetical protein
MFADGFQAEKLFLVGSVEVFWTFRKINLSSSYKKTVADII